MLRKGANGANTRLAAHRIKQEGAGCARNTRRDGARVQPVVVHHVQHQWGTPRASNTVGNAAATRNVLLVPFPNPVWESIAPESCAGGNCSDMFRVSLNSNYRDRGLGLVNGHPPKAECGLQRSSFYQLNLGRNSQRLNKEGMEI